MSSARSAWKIAPRSTRSRSSRSWTNTKCQAGSAPGGDDRQLEQLVAGEPLQVAGRELAPAREERRRAARAALRPSAAADVGQPVVVAELDHRVGPVARAPRARSRSRGCGSGGAARRGRRDRSGPRRPRPSSGSWPGGGSGRSCRPASRRLGRRDVAPSECDASAMIVSGPAGRAIGDRPQRAVVGRLAGVVDRRGWPASAGVIAAATRVRARSAASPGSMSAKRGVGAGVEDGVRGGHERHRRRDRLVARARGRPRPPRRGAPPSRS